MIKICILTTVHPPFDTRIFHKQAKTLVKAGYEVTLIAQHERSELVDGVKIIALPKPRNRVARMLCLSWRAFRLARRERAAIYHFHDPELIPVGLLLKLRGKRVIYDVHEDVPKQILSKEWIPGLSAGLWQERHAWLGRWRPGLLMASWPPLLPSPSASRQARRY